MVLYAHSVIHYLENPTYVTLYIFTFELLLNESKVTGAQQT